MRTDLPGYVMNAVLVEGRSVTEVCEAHRTSRTWLYEADRSLPPLGNDGRSPDRDDIPRRRRG